MRDLVNKNFEWKKEGSKLAQPKGLADQEADQRKFQSTGRVEETNQTK